MVGDQNRTESQEFENIKRAQQTSRTLRLPEDWDVTENSFPGIFCIKYNRPEGSRRVFLGEAEQDAWLEMNATFEFLANETFEESSELLADYINAGRGAFECEVLVSSPKYEDQSERSKALAEYTDLYLNAGYVLYDKNPPRTRGVDIRDITSIDNEITQQEDS